MNQNYYKLKFNNTITRLAGYEFGENTFKEQIGETVDYSNTPIYIEFPEQVIKVASSFVQGFFRVLIDKFGYNLIGKEVIIETKNQSLIDSIKDNLM